MSSAIELVLIFIALEISSISTYICRLPAPRSRQQRIVLKYFLLGSFATAFFLYGVAMMFGATGPPTLMPSRMRLLRTRSLHSCTSRRFDVYRPGFKVASAPFHI